jgi:hypothetical protein
MDDEDGLYMMGLCILVDSKQAVIVCPGAQVVDLKYVPLGESYNGNYPWTDISDDISYMELV